MPVGFYGTQANPMQAPSTLVITALEVAASDRPNGKLKVTVPFHRGRSRSIIPIRWTPSSSFISERKDRGSARRLEALADGRDDCNSQDAQRDRQVEPYGDCR